MACYLRELDDQWTLSKFRAERYQELPRITRFKPVKYSSSLSLRRWTWEHIEQQLKIRVGWHEWEVERVCEEQCGILRLRELQSVSRLDPDFKKWLEAVLWAKQFDKKIQRTEKGFRFVNKL